jgi:hypothetical protein
MQIAAKFFEYGLLAWFGLLALLIAIRVLRGDIVASGLLCNRSPDENVTPERVLMMAIFPSVVVFYAYNALTGELPIVDGRPSLPDVPQNLIALLTGTNSLYLAGKIARG